jgi:hypothetical protein
LVFLQTQVHNLKGKIMALKMTKTFAVHGGVEALVPGAVGRVRALHGGKNLMEIELSWFKDGSHPVAFLTQHFEFTPALDGDNFIAQAYVYLKTLPEFAAAVDC